MKKVLRYFVGLIPAILAIIYVYISRTNLEYILSSVGLFYGAIGASLALTSDLNLLKNQYVPAEKLDQIRSARDTLYEEKIIQRGDDGYDAVLDIVTTEFDIDREPDCLTYGLGSGRRASNHSGGKKIYGYQKNGEFSVNEIDTSESYASILGSDNYDSFSIGPVPLFDSRISFHIMKIEKENLQNILLFGWYLLLIGFFLQLIPNISNTALEFII